MKNIVIGITFSILWASASIATKIGLKDTQPFILANVRFAVAGFIMLTYAIISGKKIRVSSKEFLQLCIYGFLNVTLYLGTFVLAMKHLSAGIGSLAIAISPLFITVFSTIFLKKQSKTSIWIGLFLSLFGVLLAAYPLLKISYADEFGLTIILLSMVTYSIGTIYYSSINWKLDRVVINGWQVFLGGLFLTPITYFYFEPNSNNYTLNFWFSMLWLVVPVSILAVNLWLYLLKIDTIKASLWLFLCPIFGFVFSNVLLNEPISWHTFVGTAVVLLGLFVGQFDTLFKGSR